MDRESTRFPVTGMWAEARRLPEGTARGFVAFLRDEQTHFFALSAVVGICAGAIALGVRSLTVLIASFAYGGWGGSVLETVRQAPWWVRLLVPAAGGIVAGILVTRVARRGGGAGISGIMEAVTIRHGFISLRRSLWTGLASVVALATGGSVGREGPITHLACAAGSRLGRSFGLTDARVRVLVAAAAGAGIAAAYNTPIAGTLFVLEVVAGSFATDLIGPTVIAAVAGTLVARIYLWDGPIYEVPEFVFTNPQEILAYAGLGLLAGSLAALFIGSLRLGELFFRRLHVPRWVRTGLGGLMVGALALRLPEVCGNGYESIVDILNARVGMWALVFLLAGKLIATTASVTSGSPGGVFTPTLFLGAALGGLAGNLVHHVFPDATGGPSSYALVGMGALLAATTHAPMTATVLIAELTGDYFVVLPQLLACSLAATLTYRMDSIYTRELRRRGINWVGTLEQKIVHSMKARDIMRTDVAVLRPNAPFEEVVRAFSTTRAPCLYVVDDEHRLTGVIELHGIKDILGTQDLSNVVIAQDLAEPSRSVPADTSLATVSEKLWFLDTGEAPVVEGAEGHFLGVVTQRDLLGFLDREILRRNLLLSEVRWRDGFNKGVDFLELPEGFRLESLEVPPDLVGMTMEQAQLRSRHGLNVIAIANVDPVGNERRYPPAPGYHLGNNDKLVVVASSEDLEAFSRLRTART
jgi:CIC family chloride channel protein